MKIIAINGSPRKKGSSARMLESRVDGVKAAYPEIDIQRADLYDLTFTGCGSCFACKRKGAKTYGTRPIRDGIHDLVPAVCILILTASFP